MSRPENPDEYKETLNVDIFYTIWSVAPCFRESATTKFPVTMMYDFKRHFSLLYKLLAITAFVVTSFLL